MEKVAKNGYVRIITGKIFEKPFLHVAVILVVSFLVYSNTFSSPFIFDDLPNIINNAQIKDLNNFWPPSGTRWFGFLTFALNYRIGGLDTFGYHVVNLVIHMLNSVLVYWLVSLTFRTPRVIYKGNNLLSLIPFLAGLLFACHPIQIQAVTYIVQRFTSIATMFYLLSMLLYIKARLLVISKEQLAKSNELNADKLGKTSSQTSVLWYLASLSFAVLAMKTKEISFTLPVMIVIYELMFLEGSVRKRIIYLTPFIVTMLIIPVTLIGSFGSISEIKGIDEVTEKISETKDIPRLHYLYTQFSVVVKYIRLLFLPINQNLYYDHSVYSSFFNADVLISFLFLLLMLAFGIYLIYAKRSTLYASRLLSFGIFWFFITLSVESSIIPIRDVMFEHRIYLPSVGFFISFISGIDMLCTRWENTRKVIVYAVIILAAVLSVATYNRNAVWRDSISIWEDTVRKSPNKVGPRNNLGNAYLDQGRIDEAINEFTTALRIGPDYADAHNNLGIVYIKQGNIDEAINEYTRALQINPNYAAAHSNLGNAYARQGRSEEAIKEFLAALKIKPDFAEVHYNLGVVYAGQGSIGKAISEYISALKINPDFAEAHYNLGCAYADQGHFNEAIKEYEAALKINPNITEVHNNLGVAYGNIGRIDEAMHAFQEALKINPSDIKALQNLDFYSQVKSNMKR